MQASRGNFSKAKERKRTLGGKGCAFGVVGCHPLSDFIAKSRETGCLERQTSPRSQSVHAYIPSWDLVTCLLIPFQGFCTSIRENVLWSNLLSHPSTARSPKRPVSRAERDGVLEQRRQMSLVLSPSDRSLVLGHKEGTLARA